MFWDRKFRWLRRGNSQNYLGFRGAIGSRTCEDEAWLDCGRSRTQDANTECCGKSRNDEVFVEPMDEVVICRRDAQNDTEVAC